MIYSSFYELHNVLTIEGLHENPDMKTKYNIENLSENLRMIRNKSGKSQALTSHEVGISLRSYQKIESNDPPNIKLTTLVNILKCFDVTIEELLK